MKRPELPTGDHSETARLLRVVTHPTEVIRRVAVKAERAGEASPRLLLILARWSVVLVIAGTVVVVLAFVIRPVVELAIPLLIVGMLLISAGFCMATLECLIDPERPEIDQRLASVIRKAVRR